MLKFSNVYINGLGAALPKSIRKNDDPIFNTLEQSDVLGKELFCGYRERRYLQEDEIIEDFMVEAVHQALEQSTFQKRQISHLLGYCSVPPYHAPNGLAYVAQQSKLKADCLILPINNEFNNLNCSIMMSAALLKLDPSIVSACAVGSNWTRHVDYETAASISAGDGAGAVIVSASTEQALFKVKAFVSTQDSTYYGAMYMGSSSYEKPTFHLTQEGAKAFGVFGMNAPIFLSLKLLKDLAIKASDVTIVMHQASSVLIDYWAKAIQPGQIINSIEDYGNMTLATTAVNLAFYQSSIQKRYVIILGLGIEQQATALLLETM